MRTNRILTGASVLLLAALSWSALLSAPNRKKANVPVPAPKWNKTVLDVFFDDARKQLVGDRPDFASTGVPAGANVGTAPGGEGGANTPAAAGGFVWSKLISRDT